MEFAYDYLSMKHKKITLPTMYPCTKPYSNFKTLDINVSQTKDTNNKRHKRL